jgi:hypothetical protein
LFDVFACRLSLFGVEEAVLVFVELVEDLELGLAKTARAAGTTEAAAEEAAGGGGGGAVPGLRLLRRGLLGGDNAHGSRSGEGRRDQTRKDSRQATRG